MSQRPQTPSAVARSSGPVHAWGNATMTGASGTSPFLQRPSSRPSTAASTRSAATTANQQLAATTAAVSSRPTRSPSPPSSARQLPFSSSTPLGGSLSATTSSGGGSSATNSKPNSRPNSRPQSAAMMRPNSGSSVGSVAATQVIQRNLGLNSNSQVAPPLPQFTPYSPNVPFNSFTPFTGPYAYLSHNVPPQQTQGAHIDWLRMEVLKRDVRVMSETIKAAIDFQQSRDKEKQAALDAAAAAAAAADPKKKRGSLSKPPSTTASTRSFPAYAPLPLPLLTQLGGVGLLHSISTRSLAAAAAASEEESKESTTTTDGIIKKQSSTVEDAVPSAEWEQLVNRALQRFGHSSDYLQSLTSTVGLLEVWAVQVGRVTETASWMSEKALSNCQVFQQFAAKQSKTTLQAPQQQTGLFNFKTSMGDLIPHASSLSGDPSQALLGSSASTGSLALSNISSASTTSPHLTESSLFHALPSLGAVFERLQLLTKFINWSEGQFVRHRESLETSRSESRTLKQEISVLAAAVKEAAEDRPQTKRVIHEHIRVTVSRPGTAATHRTDDTERVLETDRGSSARSSRPASAAAVRQSSPSSIRVPPLPLQGAQNQQQEHLEASGAFSHPTIESLQHEVWLLRQSLEEERRGRDDNHSKEVEHLANQLKASQNAFSESQRAKMEADRLLAAARADLKTKENGFDVALQRLRLQLSEMEKDSSQKWKNDLEANQERMWEERLKAERAHRDKVEAERWAIHVKTMEVLQKKLDDTTAELTAAKATIELLRAQGDSNRSEEEKRCLALLLRVEMEEKERAAEAERAAREEASRKAFELTFLEKKKQLEKEMKSKDDSSNAALASLEEELNRLRREKDHLETALKESANRDLKRGKQWSEQADAVDALRKDLEKEKKAREELESRLETEQKSSAEARERYAAQHAKDEAEIQRLRALLHKTESEFADLNARFLALQSSLKKGEKEVTESATLIQTLRERIVSLESALAASNESLNTANEKRKRGEEKLQADLEQSRAEIEELRAIIRGLEGHLKAARDDVAAASSLSSPKSPLKSSSSKLLTSPSSTTSLHTRSPSRPGSPMPLPPKQASKEETNRRDLELAQWSLQQSQELLLKQESDLDKLRQILKQQKEELIQEQQMLHTSSQLLHSELFARLQKLLPLNFAAISNLLASLPTEQTQGVSLVSVDELRDRFRDATEQTDAISRNVHKEITQPATEVYTDSLGARLAALRRACEFHENRLQGLAPSANTAKFQLPQAIANGGQQPVLSLTTEFGQTKNLSTTSGSPLKSAMSSTGGIRFR